MRLEHHLNLFLFVIIISLILILPIYQAYLPPVTKHHWGLHQAKTITSFGRLPFPSHFTTSSPLPSSSSGIPVVDDEIIKNDKSKPKQIYTATVSHEGTDPDRPGKINQDAHFSFSFLHPQQHSTNKTNNNNNDASSHHNLTCIGIMDGHGIKGHSLTNYLRDQLPRNIRAAAAAEASTTESAITSIPSSYLNDTTTPNDTLARLLTTSFEQSHADAIQNPSIPAGRSGTTCVTCLIDPHRPILYVASVGDSRAILGYYSNKTWSCRRLSNETTTKRPSERLRIEQSEGGRIDASGNVFYGPVGIAMTRALGDAVMLRAGVIPTPEIRRYDEKEIMDGCFFVLLGTDGVFDVLSDEEVVEIVGICLEDGEGGLESAAERVVDVARERWRGGLPMEVKVDDITCVIAWCC